MFRLWNRILEILDWVGNGDWYNMDYCGKTSPENIRFDVNAICENCEKKMAYVFYTGDTFCWDCLMSQRKQNE
jgi:hypothetical protein